MLFRSDQATEAKRKQAELAKRVGSVRVDVASRPGLTLTFDGEPLPRDVEGRAFYATVGTHEIVASAPGAEDERVSVTVDPGKLRTVELRLRSKRAAAPVAREPAAASSPVLAYALLGVGVVGGAVGTYFALDAKKRRDDLDATCIRDICSASKLEDIEAEIGRAHV